MSLHFADEEWEKLKDSVLEFCHEEEVEIHGDQIRNWPMEYEAKLGINVQYIVKFFSEYSIVFTELHIRSTKSGFGIAITTHSDWLRYSEEARYFPFVDKVHEALENYRKYKPLAIATMNLLKMKVENDPHLEFYPYGLFASSFKEEDDFFKLGRVHYVWNDTFESSCDIQFNLKNQTFTLSSEAVGKKPEISLDHQRFEEWMEKLPTSVDFKNFGWQERRRV